MSSFTFHNVAIRAISAAVPDHTIKLDTSNPYVAKFVKQIGIKQVHLSITEQSPIDIGYVAINQALAHAGWTPEDLDLVIFDTQYPDFLGGTGDSCLLHHYLNLRQNCAVFDMTVGCAAFPYSLTVACSMMQGSDDIRKVALLNGDMFWWYKAKNKQELIAQNQHLFGDCTGVILLEKVNPGESPDIKTKLFAQGHGYMHLIDAPSFKNSWHCSTSKYRMPDGEIVETQPGHGFLYMNGAAINDFSTEIVVQSIKENFHDNIYNYDYYIFHQANKYILNSITSELNLDPEKVLFSLDQYGNTASASAINVICHKLNNIKAPVHVFNASFGIGLSWGFSEFTISPNTVRSIVSTDNKLTDHCITPL